MLKNISRPLALVDEYRCRRNIETMSRKAAGLNLRFRPHFKTHQSVEIGRWFRDHSLDGITVSTPEMASYFISDGWMNVTIAFPFYPGQIQQINELNESANLKLFINRNEDLLFLEKNLRKRIDFYIELDAGYSRTGLSVEDLDSIEKIIHTAKKSSRCHFHGFYIHEGRTYRARGVSEIKAAFKPAFQAISTLKDIFPSAAFCAGDTPSASVLDAFDDVDELSPGNFVFYDLMQTQIGSCSIEDVAFFVVCPVVQIVPDLLKFIVHGGAVHFSKDFIMIDGKQSYGQAIHVEDGSKNRFFDDVHLIALSQEHGTVQISDDFLDKKNLNDPLWFCPVHSCLSANLYKIYHTADGRILNKRILS